VEIVRYSREPSCSFEEHNLPDATFIMIQLTREAIDYHGLTEAVRDPHHGAVVLFLGTVRDMTGEDRTLRLEYEAYEPMAAKKLQEILAQVQQQWPGAKVAIVHRLGVLEVGEVSVAVAVSTPHRAEAFAACRYVMEAIKADVPIWKKDIGPEGKEQWVHPDVKTDSSATTTGSIQ
jgi:molybdopterin synthase catalytic subunit